MVILKLSQRGATLAALLGAFLFAWIQLFLSAPIQAQLGGSPPPIMEVGPSVRQAPAPVRVEAPPANHTDNASPPSGQRHAQS